MLFYVLFSDPDCFWSKLKPNRAILDIVWGVSQILIGHGGWNNCVICVIIQFIVLVAQSVKSSVSC